MKSLALRMLDALRRWIGGPPPIAETSAGRVEHPRADHPQRNTWPRETIEC